MNRTVQGTTLRTDFEAKQVRVLGPRILVVEDDASIRETLEDLLSSEGYDVVSAEHAEAGLQKLQGAGRVDLVLTDYALPGNTGTWMVAEARKRNLLKGAQTVVITAHPQIENPEGLDVIRKPLDVDDFLERIHNLLEPVRVQAVNASQDWFSQYLNRKDAGSGARIQLVLYISAHSPSSLKALRNAQRLLERYEMAQVDFRICDLSKEPPDAGEADKIAFTPTLVKRSPEPRTWILGDLDNTRTLEDLLVLSGVEIRK